MSLKARLRKAAFNRHILLGKLETRPNLTNFIDRFRATYKPCNLVRIGSGADGGYLLPDALDGLAYCFSPGVADSADFENELSKLFEKDFLRLVSIIFEKLFKNFAICHVHPNNCCGLTELDGIAVPRVMEVTFVRHDILPKVLRQDPVQLPHPLDVKNVPHLPEILMPEIWWKE